MIALDSPVVVKWFKPGERHEAEALDLRQRIQRREVEAVVNELVLLEVVRALQNAQARNPGLGLSNAVISSAFTAPTGMAQNAILSFFVK